MKNYLVLFLILLQSVICKGQMFNFWGNYADLSKYEILDSAYMKYSYKVIYLKDSLEKDIKSEDQQILLIGENTSKYYSQYALDYYYFIMEYLKTHDAYPKNSKLGAWSYEVYKKSSNKKLTITDVASILREDFIYEEDIPQFNWKISTDTQTILSYVCQKATTSFRGRDYIAWFAPGIPIPNGPWKFGGLPGLILKLYDTDENFIFECDGIEYLKEKEPIKFYKLEYVRLKRKELNKLYQRFHEDVGAYTESKGSKLHLSGGGILSLPYNPIELE